MSSIRSTPHDSRVFFPSIASERFLADCSFHLSGWNTFRPFPKSIPGVPHSICVFYLEYLASTLEYFCTRHAAFHHFFVTYGHFFFNSSLSIHPLPLAVIFVSPRIFHPSLLSDVHYPISCVLFQVTSYHFQNASLSLNSFLCPTSTHLIHCPSTSQVKYSHFQNLSLSLKRFSVLNLFLESVKHPSVCGLWSTHRSLVIFTHPQYLTCPLIPICVPHRLQVSSIYKIPSSGSNISHPSPVPSIQHPTSFTHFHQT